MKAEPPKPPWPARAWRSVWAFVTWPFVVSYLKRSGYKRTGWMTWEHRGG